MTPHVSPDYRRGHDYQTQEGPEPRLFQAHGPAGRKARGKGACRIENSRGAARGGASRRSCALGPSSREEGPRLPQFKSGLTLQFARSIKGEPDGSFHWRPVLDPECWLGQHRTWRESYQVRNRPASLSVTEPSQGRPGVCGRATRLAPADYGPLPGKHTQSGNVGAQGWSVRSGSLRDPDSPTNDGQPLDLSRRPGCRPIPVRCGVAQSSLEWGKAELSLSSSVKPPGWL